MSEKFYEDDSYIITRNEVDRVDVMAKSLNSKMKPVEPINVMTTDYYSDEFDIIHHFINEKTQLQKYIKELKRQAKNLWKSSEAVSVKCNQLQEENKRLRENITKVIDEHPVRCPSMTCGADEDDCQYCSSSPKRMLKQALEGK